MFIAMNRFRIARGSEEAFEQVWLNRDSQLNTVPGFVEFHLLKGPHLFVYRRGPEAPGEFSQLGVETINKTVSCAKN